MHLQLNYSSTRKHGLIGYKSDSGPSYVVSAFCESVVEPGSLVVFNGDKKCRPLGVKEDLDLAMGIVLSEGFVPKPNCLLSVMRSGRVWVEAGAEIDTAGSPVFVNLKTGAFVAKKEADSFQLKGACFVQRASVGESVELELNLTGGRQ